MASPRSAAQCAAVHPHACGECPGPVEGDYCGYCREMYPERCAQEEAA
jgi:hypothetical protein